MKNINFLSTVTKAKNYLKAILWLSKDGLKHSTKLSLSIVVASFVGVSSGVLAFTIIAGYLKYQIEGKLISLKYIKLPVPPPGAEGLIIYGSIALVIGIVSASLIYYSRWGALKVSQEYQIHCTLLSIDRLINQDSSLQSNLKFISPKHSIWHIPRVYCRYVAFTYRFLLEAIIPLGTLIFTGFLLVFMDVYVTASLIPFALAFSIPIYRINKRSSKIQGKLLNMMEQFMEWLRVIIVNLSNNGNPYIKNDIQNLLRNNHELNTMTSTLYERILLKFNADFFSRCLIILCMVWLFIVFGIQVINEKRTWLSILTYLIALRFLGSSLLQVSAKFINVSRFYPAVDTYRKFIETEFFKKEQNHGSAGFWAEDVILRISNKQESKHIGKGDSNLLLLPVNPNQKFLESIFQKNCTNYNDIFTSDKYLFHKMEKPIESLTFLQNIIGNSDDAEILSNVENKLNELGVLEKINNLDNGLNTVCSKETIKNLDVDEIFTICNCFSSIIAEPTILIGVEDISVFTKYLQKEKNYVMNDKIVIYTCNWFNAQKDMIANLYNFDNIFVSDGSTIIAEGNSSYIVSNYEKINEQLKSIDKNELESFKGAADALEADLDMDDNF